jgi:hypothetical protein
LSHFTPVTEELYARGWPTRSRRNGAGAESERRPPGPHGRTRWVGHGGRSPTAPTIAARPSCWVSPKPVIPRQVAYGLARLGGGAWCWPTGRSRPRAHRSTGRSLGSLEEADGQVWHLPAGTPNRPAVSDPGMRDSRARAEGGFRPRPIIRLVGVFNPVVWELNETLYQFERDFVSDASKFLGAFGPFEPTPHREAVQRTVEWFRHRYGARNTGLTSGRSPRMVCGPGSLCLIAD